MTDPTGRSSGIPQFEPAGVDPVAGLETVPEVPSSTLVYSEESLGQTVAGKYILREQLGRGGMGRVYRAEHVELGTPVAIKLMHARLISDSGYVRRFRREARAAAAVDHPNVVRILDFGEHGNKPYLAMEFVEGTTLERWLAELPGLPKLADVAWVGKQILLALAALHQHEVIHRDLKPANLVRGSSPHLGPFLKVLDFGLARFSDARDVGPPLTELEEVAGTPEYMSPEQTRSLRVGKSTDLYAFGCILTELLQGRPPFSGASAMDVFSQHLYAPVPPLSRAPDAEAVPEPLDRLRLELLAKHASRRPQDVSEVQQRWEACFDASSLVHAMSSREHSGEGREGIRKERIPSWNPPTLARASSTAPPTGPLQVDWWVPDASALRPEPALEVGLHMLGTTLALVQSPAEGEVGRPLVLDASASPTSIPTWLSRLGPAPLARRVVLCVQAAPIEQINTWIELGVADVVTHPLTSDELDRRLKRLARRRGSERVTSPDPPE